MVASLLNVYKGRREKFWADLRKVETKINVISNLRLLVAALFIVAIYFSFSQSWSLYVAAILLVIFLYFVKRHALAFARKTHLEHLVEVNTREINVLQGKLDGLADGVEFLDPQHPYAHDLDIFGAGSLFQSINRCNTRLGKARLASSLTAPLEDKRRIDEVQSAVRDARERIEFRQHFQAAGMEIPEQSSDIPQLLRWIQQPPLLKTSPFIKIFLVIVPLLTLASLVTAFIFPYAKIALWCFVLVQWISTGIYLKDINAFHDYISKKKNILQKYSTLLQYLGDEQFSSSIMKELSKEGKDAHTKVQELASLVNALDARTNAMVTLFVNSFLLYDLQCVYRLEQWKKANGDKLKTWIDTISSAELLNTFATFSYNNPQFTFPEIKDELRISATALAHPLIRQEERIANDFTMGPAPQVFIVTGANMAGKSTFLRTIGVNLVLALQGAPVCAEQFSCPIIALRSGMRTADSLKDHQSYFFAELNRLKSIMDDLRKDIPLLILLDEILKGTNSNDKQAGSIALVKQLLPHPCLAIIATHDLVLGEMEGDFPDRVRNYCFEADIRNDQLSFDYKLKNGIAQKMNASFLMKKMGIIPDRAG
jgi:ABC-type multidrug transport system fused ATPase/permease subunit